MPAKKTTASKKNKGSKNILKKSSTQSSKADLVLPIAKFMRLMKMDRLNERISRNGAVMMTGILEYLIKEILETSGNIVLEKNKKRIVNRHLYLGIQQDEEMQKLLADAIIFGGGVVPHIEPALLP